MPGTVSGGPGHIAPGRLWGQTNLDSSPNPVTFQSCDPQARCVFSPIITCENVSVFTCDNWRKRVLQVLK